MITGICVDYLYVRQSEAVFVIEDMIQAEAKAVVMIGCTITETTLPPCVCQTSCLYPPESVSPADSILQRV